MGRYAVYKQITGEIINTGIQCISPGTEKKSQDPIKSGIGISIIHKLDKCGFLSDSVSCRSGSFCKQLPIHVHLKYNHGMQGQGDTIFSRAVKNCL